LKKRKKAGKRTKMKEKNIKKKKKEKKKTVKGIVNSFSYIHCGEYDVMWG